MPTNSPTTIEQLRSAVSTALADKVFKTLSELEGYTPPETPQDWACVGAAQCIRALCEALKKSEPIVSDAELASRCEQYEAAMRWVYENGMKPDHSRPDWVSWAFNKAFEPVRQERERRAMACAQTLSGGE